MFAYIELNLKDRVLNAKLFFERKVAGALPCIEVRKIEGLPQWHPRLKRLQDNHKLLREPTLKETKTRRKPPN
jgi:hypothetical protein